MPRRTTFPQLPLSSLAGIRGQSVPMFPALVLAVGLSPVLFAQTPPAKTPQSKSSEQAAKSKKWNEYMAQLQAADAAATVKSFASTIEQAVAVEDVTSLEDVCEFYQRDPRNTECPPLDPWGTRLQVLAETGFSSYGIVSAMADKTFEKKPAMGLQAGFSRDIVFFNGAFIQLPRSLSREYKGDLKVVTAEEYADLETGMTMKQARRTIGAPGTELSQSRIGDATAHAYQWKNPDGSNVIAIFQNDVLVSKAQSGLSR